jgi:hypothetical protein
VNPEPSQEEIPRIDAERTALGHVLHNYIIANIDSICESDIPGQTPSTTFLTIAAKVSGTYMEFLAADRQNLAKLNGNAEVCIVDHGLNSDRDIAWSKVVAMRALLEVGKRNIVWIDADALAVNPKSFADIEAEFFPASKSILFTNDFDEGYDKDASALSSINSGVMITRNTAWSTHFWKSVWEDFPEALHNNIVWEQKAVLMYREANPTDFAENAHIIPHRIMNTGTLEHRPEDFIIHAAGGHGKNKYNDLLNIYCNYTHLEPCRHIGLR